jgi:hypothetical protein
VHPEFIFVGFAGFSVGSCEGVLMVERLTSFTVMPVLGNGGIWMDDDAR